MLICVTNRKLCKDHFLQRINQLAKGKPHAIMLREKDLNPIEYEALARKVKTICEENQVPLIIHQNISIAKKLELSNIHLPMDVLRENKNRLWSFNQIGASVHSLSEAKEAEQLGATYIIAGHIFSTDCKKGIPPRGLVFLNEICESVTIPVFAIGGITKNKLIDIVKTGAKGVCLMSETMTSQNPSVLSASFSFDIGSSIID